MNEKIYNKTGKQFLESIPEDREVWVYHSDYSYAKNPPYVPERFKCYHLPTEIGWDSCSHEDAFIAQHLNLIRIAHDVTYTSVLWCFNTTSIPETPNIPKTCLIADGKDWRRYNTKDERSLKWLGKAIEQCRVHKLKFTQFATRMGNQYVDFTKEVK